MSRGKYSPTVYYRKSPEEGYIYNAKGEIPPSTWADGEYSTEIHFVDYDSEGFDRYGYSAYDSEGNYVDIGRGVDRNGCTENDYLCMSAEEFDNL
jgi:hypothetical protein